GLKDLNRLLLPGRFLLLTVPAHMSLWSYFDVAARHCRRYTVEELRQKLIEAGFDIEYISEFMMPLFPLVWTARRLRSTAPTASGNVELAEQELKLFPVFNCLMTWLLSRAANLIGRGRRLPFGTYILALAKQPATEPNQ